MASCVNANREGERPDDLSSLIEINRRVRHAGELQLITSFDRLDKDIATPMSGDELVEMNPKPTPVLDPLNRGQWDHVWMAGKQSEPG